MTKHCIDHLYREEEVRKVNKRNNWTSWIQRSLGCIRVSFTSLHFLSACKGSEFFFFWKFKSRKLHVQWACGSPALSYLIQVECLWTRYWSQCWFQTLRPWDREGARSSTPCDRGGGESPKLFSTLWASVQSKKREGGGRTPPGPSPRSTKGFPVNFCLWDPWSEKILLVGPGILEIFSCGI